MLPRVVDVGELRLILTPNWTLEVYKWETERGQKRSRLITQTTVVELYRGLKKLLVISEEIQRGRPAGGSG